MTNSMKLIPINVLQHPALSLPARLLLLAQMFASFEGDFFIGTDKIAVILGLAEDEESVTDAHRLAIRQARTVLGKETKDKDGNTIRGAALLHEKRKTKGGKSRDVWKVVESPMTQASLEVLSSMGRSSNGVRTQYSGHTYQSPVVPEPKSSVIIPDDYEIEFY